MSSPTSDLPIQLAARLLAEGRPAEAADRLRAITREAPTYAAAHVLHATALESAGDPEAALDAWGRAAALVPLSPLVHRERGRLMAALWVPDADDEELPPAVPASEEDVPEDVDAELDALIESLSALGEDDDGGGDEPEAASEPEAEKTGDIAREPEVASESTSDAESPETVREAEVEESDLDAATAEDIPELESASVRADEDEPVAIEDGNKPDFEVADTAELLPPEEGAPEPVPVVPEAVDPDGGDGDGWDVLTEEPVPSPPPDPRVEPDVIAPEPKPSDPEPQFVVADELDALISQLEDAPRIKPDPAFSGPAVSFDTGDMSEMYSETLAEIYAAQHQYVEAAVVYEKLAQRNPEAAEEMLRKAAALRERK